jgi:hypothetical protein
LYFKFEVKCLWLGAESDYSYTPIALLNQLEMYSVHAGFCRIFATKLCSAKTVDRSLFGKSSNQNNRPGTTVVHLSKLLGGIPVAKILQNPAFQVACQGEREDTLRECSMDW